MGGFADLDAMGNRTSERILSDMDPDLFNSNSALPHGMHNDLIISADGEGKCISGRLS